MLETFELHFNLKYLKSNIGQFSWDGDAHCYVRVFSFRYLYEYLRMCVLIFSFLPSRVYFYFPWLESRIRNYVPLWKNDARRADMKRSIGRVLQIYI